MGPCDGRPESCFHHRFLKDNGRHFEVRVGEAALWVGVRDYIVGEVGWPLDPPYTRRQGDVRTKPNASSSERTQVVAISRVVQPLLHELFDVCWSAGQVAYDVDNVQESTANFFMATEANGLWQTF